MNPRAAISKARLGGTGVVNVRSPAAPWVALAMHITLLVAPWAKDTSGVSIIRLGTTASPINALCRLVEILAAMAMLTERVTTIRVDVRITDADVSIPERSRE
jgi:hypothetical protein